jgi:hypothetical protein
MRTLRQLSVFGLAAAISFGAAAAPKKRAPKEKPAVSASAKGERAAKADPKPKHSAEKKPADKTASSRKQGEKTGAKHDKPATTAEKKRGEPAKPTPARGAKTSPRLRAEPEVPAPAARGSMRPGNRYLDIPAREIAESKKAFLYANLSDEQALAELTRRNIPFVTARAPMPGVRTPIRLTGPLHGVTIRSTLPPAQRRTTFFEILDARLAIALDDFCALLARHDVVELVHFTMYRPPGELPPNFGEPLTRHPGGLAIDLGALRKRDGNLLAVGPHWPSNIGAKTCGDGAEQLWERPGRELLSIVCEASDEGLFHYILTPRFDSAHGDHLHLEIKPETRWFLVN